MQMASRRKHIQARGGRGRGSEGLNKLGSEGFKIARSGGIKSQVGAVVQEL